MSARMFGAFLAFAAWLALAAPAMGQQSGTARLAQPVRPESASSPSLPPPAHPATLQQVREYLELTGVLTASRNSMVVNVNAMRMQAMPYLPGAFWDDLKSAMLKLDLVAIYAPALQRYLSQSDMEAILAFYRSPAGRAFLSAQPVIARDAQGALRTKTAEVGNAVYARHKDEIEAAKKKYDAAHAGGAK